jgi:hypothetical protein
MNRMSPEMGVFVFGATGTRYSCRPITDVMHSAYNGNAEVVSSALFSTDPPQDNVLVDLLKENSGQKVDIYVHSSGGAQFQRAVRQAGEVDMGNMTVVAIDIPRGPSNLVHGMKIVSGEVTRAIDSLTAFHPDDKIISLSNATDVLRQVFPHLVQNGSELPTVDYQSNTSIDYFSSLTGNKLEEVTQLDKEIAAANTTRNFRTLFLQRGNLLYEDIESIYHGDNRRVRPPNEEEGEIKRERSLRAYGESARILPAVIRGNAWEFLRELERKHDNGEGPRVVIAIPEWGQYISRTDAEEIYSSAGHRAENIIFLSGLSHSGFALQPQVIRGIKNHINLTAA